MDIPQMKRRTLTIWSPGPRHTIYGFHEPVEVTGAPRQHVVDMRDFGDALARWMFRREPGHTWPPTRGGGCA